MSGFTIRRLVPLQLVLPDETMAPVGCEMQFSVDDPYTIQAVFAGSTWLIGRELLAHGLLADLSCPAGQGDVKIWRDESPEYLLIALSGVEGDALLAAEADAVAEFLQDTKTLVPFGSEGPLMESAIDAIITALLGA